MSSYLHFYLRNPENDTYTHLCSYRNNTEIYNLFDSELTYGTLCPISLYLIDVIYDNVLEDIRLSKSQINSYNNNIEIAKTMDGSFEERIDFIQEQKDMIAICKSEIEEYTMIKGTLNLFIRLINCAPDTSDQNAYLYGGIDAPRP